MTLSSHLKFMHGFVLLASLGEVSTITVQMFVASFRWYSKRGNLSIWKLLAVVLDTHIKCVDKIHKWIDPTLVMLPLN